MLHFERHYKFKTILYSLEPKKLHKAMDARKLGMHGNWGRTETGDTTVYISH